MEVYKSKFIEISYESENQLIYSKWLPATDKMAEFEFKECMIQWKNIVMNSDYQITKVFNNSTDFNFTVVPEVQTWVGDNITKPSTRMGIQKIGFLVSQRLFPQISIEQTLEETPANSLEVRYFAEEKKVRSWLLE